MRGQTQYGKGSAQRPTDSKKYGDNFDAIFGKLNVNDHSDEDIEKDKAKTKRKEKKK
ncbi:hypothetical protein [Alteromonas sp.]|uniref:hypothetical protein n=1 Tax=Alteromonas sp. TaxID=232 RepID=UPI00257EFFBE|nr:hypothetical protein [Alteromonas sp.]|tara:strand:- start:4380 stop:4550 length:171 start_codon:yes stop_codon:yes gene_type:complete